VSVPCCGNGCPTTRTCAACRYPIAALAEVPSLVPAPERASARFARFEDRVLAAVAVVALGLVGLVLVLLASSCGARGPAPCVPRPSLSSTGPGPGDAARCSPRPE
jgi:hypothetical protein